MSDQAKRLYEAMFLVDSALATSDWDAVLAAIQNLMDRAEAEVVSMRKWDEMRLCYPIKRCTRGTYIICYFRTDPLTITNLERDVKLSDTFLRVLILKGDHLTDEKMLAPTPAMKAAESSQRQAAEAQEAQEAQEAEKAREADATAVAVLDPVPDDDIVEIPEDLPDVDDIDLSADDTGTGDDNLKVE